jgi:hypothetical protein
MDEKTIVALRLQLEEIGGDRMLFCEDDLEPGMLILCACSTDALNTDAHDITLAFKMGDIAELTSCQLPHWLGNFNKCTSRDIGNLTGTWEEVLAYFREIMTTKVAPLA